MKTTITEALSEINLIDKKLKKKRAEARNALFRYEELPDPYESEGGMKAYFNRVNQSIEDLEMNLQKIRSAIHKKNLDTKVKILHLEKSIDEWLTWKRDVYSSKAKFLQELEGCLKAEYDEVKANPKIFKKKEGEEFKIANLVSSKDLAEIERELAELIEINEKLDGQLSLKNATVVIDY